MCCFTQPVKNVRDTHIFAREGEGRAQLVVYEMRLQAKDDLAMVLPLPVDRAKGEAAVRFIDLQGYPEFFSDLRRGFPVLVTASAASRSEPTRGETLRVHQVGSYEASFVPTMDDFDRLDKRFRLPKQSWDALPEYRRFGFAVFKLKPGHNKFHPMAFSFERADATKLFFPTIHIHDGKFHLLAEFDHELYCQRSGHSLDVLDWEESQGHAGQFAAPDKAQGILAADEHCYRKILAGKLPNRDTYLGKA
jgi:hypothetical protein